MVDDHDRDRISTVDLSPNASVKPAASSAFDPPRDRFEPVGELGRGGMGRVVDAIDRGLGRSVAIKQILSTDPVAIARFEREARITARLEHPGIVPIHDAGRDRDGTPYYVMRRVDGRPLEDVVAGGSLVQRLALVPNVLAACDATAYAHARGIVHRDIKPTNLLIGPFGETLLIDWGLAREIGEPADGSLAPSGGGHLTRAGSVAGTPGFMAPEQARGEDVDARTDVFALGSTLFYVLAGQPPYTASRATEMIERVGTDHPPDWSLLPLEVPADLRAIVAKAMATDPAERYRDAGMLAADLRRFVTGNLVAAHRYGRLEQLRRFVRRHRGALAVAAISLIVVVAGAAISVRRIVAERDDARDARTLAETNQHEATATADRMLVQRARELVEKSPEGAIVLLRQLRDDSAQWPQAATIAQIAELRGVSVGFNTGFTKGLRFDMSPDGHHVYVAPLRGGVITSYDLATRTRRELGEVANIIQIRWLDADHLLVVTGDGVLQSIDVATGHRDRRQFVHTSHVETDRAGHLWALTDDKRVVALAGLHANPVELAHHAGEFTVDQKLTTAVFSHDDGTAVMWTSASTLPIAMRATHIEPITAGTNRAAWFDGHDVVVQEIVGGKLVEHIRTRLDLAQLVTFDGDRTLVMTPSSAYYVDETGQHLVDSTRSVNLVTTDPGFVIAHADGSLHVFERGGHYRTGPHPITVQRLVAGADGRFVAVITTTGDLISWDLSLLRPKRYPLESDEHIAGFDARTLWVRGMTIRRFDRTTGESTKLLSTLASQDILAAISSSRDGAMFSADQFFAAGAHRALRRPHLYDRDGHELEAVPDDAKGTGWWDRGIVFADATNALWKWTYDGHKLVHAKLCTLPFEPIIVLSEGHWTAAASETEIARIDERSLAVERLPITNLGQYALEPDGTVFVLAHGQVIRWPVHAEAAVLALPATPDSLGMSSVGRVIHMRGAIGVLEPAGIRTIASASDAMQTRDDSPWAPTVETNRSLGVVDLRSGVSFQLLGAISEDNSMFSQANTIVALDVGSSSHLGQSVYEWTMSVPDDPAKLRAWLAAATNAKLIPGSDAVIWP